MLADEGGVNCVLRSPQECHAVQCTCCALAVPCVDETSQRFVEEASMAPTDCSSVKTSLPFPSLPFPSLPLALVLPHLPSSQSRAVIINAGQANAATVSL